MEINKPRNYEKIEQVVTKLSPLYEVVDVTVECPKCRLEYNEYANCDDDWHYIKCDKCGTKYKYKVNW